jgi:hypothetical protein
LNRVVTTESTNDQPTDRDFWPISLGLITIWLMTCNNIGFESLGESHVSKSSVATHGVVIGHASGILDSTSLKTSNCHCDNLSTAIHTLYCMLISQGTWFIGDLIHYENASQKVYHFLHPLPSTSLLTRLLLAL